MQKGKRVRLRQRYIAFVLAASLCGVLPCFAAAGASAGDTVSGSEYIIRYEERTPGMDKHVYNSRAVKAQSRLEETLEPYSADMEKTELRGVELLRLDKVLSAEEEAALLRRLSSIPGVAYAEPNRVVEAFGPGAMAVSNDTYADSQWALESIRAYDAWSLMPEQTATVRVAVVDTGVDTGHPDLEGRVLPGYTAIDYDSTGKRYDPDKSEDDHGHGTHVSGIIAALCNNSRGIQGAVGDVNVEILPVKVLNDAGKGSTYDIVEGIRYAADNGADIINLSLGSNMPSELEREAIAYAQNKGCLIIAAAGNESVNVSTTYPASYDNVISVGSVDRDDGRSYFSNYGSTLDIAAPGGSIISTVPKSAAMNGVLEGKQVYGNDNDGYYIVWSGTSMATPYVVAVAAMYKAANPGASSMDIADHLIDTARDVGPIGKDEDTGAGVVDAAAMLGEDVIQRALVLLSPASGRELYQSVTLRVQVNTAMNIDHVNFYLNSDQSAPIASTACDDRNSYYSLAWDTTASADGDYTLLAVAYDASGAQVGDNCQIEITVLNHIQDGVTLHISDPEGTDAADADILVYGIDSSGSYHLLRSAYSSELGFARIKGLSASYSSYALVISGSGALEAGGGDISYVYQRPLNPSDMGSTIEIDRAGSLEAEVKLLDETGRAVKEPYVILEAAYEKAGSRVPIAKLPAFSLSQGDKLYLDEGLYNYYGYWSPDGSGNGSTYCLRGSGRIDESNRSLTMSADGAVKVFPAVADGASAVLTLSQAPGGSEIPFMSGAVSGTSIYITPGKYSAEAKLSAEYQGKTWSLELVKNKPVTVSGAETEIDFTVDLSLESFEDNGSLRHDGGTAYLYRGEILRTANTISDGAAGSDNEIYNISSGYPTFSVWKITADGSRDLVYSVQDLWQLSGSSWNSSSEYTGQVPEAGDYIAELSFDAGPFGGVSTKTITFQLRNASGEDEIDMSINMGSYFFPYASVDLYRWDEGGQCWMPAAPDAGRLAADSSSVIRGVVCSDIELNDEGINLAVVSFKYRQLGYTMDSYVGFQIYPFASLEELKNIELSEGVRMDVTILDDAGNEKNAPVYLPVRSDGGGKLGERELVDNVVLSPGTGYYGGVVYVPQGSYDYAYTVFQDGAMNYCIYEKAVTAVTGGELLLDGRDLTRLTVRIPSGWSGSRFFPVAEGAQAGAMTLADGAVFCMSRGSYLPAAEISRGGVSLRLVPERSINMTKNVTWTLGGSFTAGVELDMSRVASNQNLTGRAYLNDGQGNTVAAIARQSASGMEEYLPELLLNAGGTETAVWQGLGKFTVPWTEYKGEGEHGVFLRYDLGEGEEQSAEALFTVGASSAVIRPEASSLYSAEYMDDGTVKLTVASDVRGFKILRFDILPDAAERSIQTELIRDGRTVKSFSSEKLYTESSHSLSIGLNLQPGDSVVLRCR